MQIGGGGLLFEVGRQRVDELELLQCSRFRLDGIGADCVGGLADQI
jgi:hypothetical protein